ncbi:unnamed protein product [Rodentolepis nana]|uniref:PK_Tyr_Ser-Thr domain-containing protein n=1 Tax=Rodentolepis nana TaxID=102285 RepID=A0A0R3T785_RODNA|nr:unnamed protein product [Rodentolepis nana]
MLWELYSFGRLPYPRLMTNQVLAHLEAGERMEAPQDCPRFIYSLMLETWSAEPSRRPSFEAILARLQSSLSREDLEYAAAFQQHSTGDTSGSSAYDIIFDDKVA